MRLIYKNLEIYKRQVAHNIEVYNGSAYCSVTTPIEMGYVNLANFKKKQLKSQYAYLLTPKLLHKKSLHTHSFIERKREEFEVLQAKIKVLLEEADFTVEAMP